MSNTGQEEQGLDMNVLRSMQKGIAKKAGKGDGNFIYSNKLPEELDIKIAPPPAEANGIYFLEQQGWWIDGKFYLSNDTPILDGDDVIQEEIDAAKEEGDESLDALINKKKNNIPVLKKETRYLVPAFQLEFTYDKNDQVDTCKVVDDECKVIVAKPALLNALNKVVTSRPAQNGTKYGVADRVKGAPMIIGKTGKGLDTEYTAMAWNQAVELDEKYYDPKKMPNVFEITRKMAKTDDYLRSVIRNYLYGDEIIEDVNAKKEKEGEEKADAKPSARGTGSARPNPAAAKEAAEEPKTSPRPSKPKAESTDSATAAEEPKKGGGRSILGDAAKMIDELG